MNTEQLESGERASPQGRSWKIRFVEEMKSFGVIAIYLWLLLTVFSLHRSIILSEHNIDYNLWAGVVLALVNALILGKFVLVAEALHAGERLEHKPLFYSILFKSAVFAAILLACHILEDWLVRIWHGRSSAKDSMTLDEILSLAVIVFVALIPFFTAREFIRVVGKNEMKSLLLQRRNDP